MACGVNGGTGDPSTAVVHVLVDIGCGTRVCDSGLEMVWVTCSWKKCPNKAAAADPPFRQPEHSTLPTHTVLPDTHHDPLGLGSTQTEESQPRGVWRRACVHMVSEKRVGRTVWLRVIGHKCSTPWPRHHLRLRNLCATTKRSLPRKKSRFLTGTNVRSCWIPIEASFIIRQVKHVPHSHLIQRVAGDAGYSYRLKGESEASKEEMKTKLNELIVSVFRKRPALNYYQVRGLFCCDQTFSKRQDVGIP
jgi:hypothetical protein